MKEQTELTMKIINRANELGILQTDKLTALIDMDKATAQYNLRLEDMLTSSNINFAHDFIGIQTNIDRATGKFNETWLPRFAQ